MSLQGRSSRNVGLSWLFSKADPCSFGSLVLVTYRSDELDRRHPLAPLLQTRRRSRVAEIVNLSPLEETEIVEMIAAILDYERSSGI